MFLKLLAVLIVISAAAKWWMIWRQVCRDDSSPLLAAVEVIGYALAVGLIVRILG